MNRTSDLGAGLGLKAEHYEHVLACTAPGLWFEAHPENYMVAGPRLAWLQTIAERHPLSLHGVSMSLAADHLPDIEHLYRLRTLTRQVQPALLSEHLAWSTFQGQYHPDLLPFPRSHAALQRIAENIHFAQDILARPLAIENPSHYAHLDGHDYGEIEFLAELAKRTGCSLLLDINNVWVSAHNMGFDPRAYLDQFPAPLISEIHLAGCSQDANSSLLIDSHDAPVAAPVWSLYLHVLHRIGPRPTLIERDDRIPPFDELLRERDIAQTLLDNVGERP
jgi:uncharacterized protein (UPF0276 family)